MITSVQNQPLPDPPCVAYVAPELTAAAEAFVHQELMAIEATGWRVVPFALRETLYPTREALGLAHRTVVLLQGGWLRQAFSGLWACLQLGRSVLPALWWLLKDMQRLGLGRGRSRQQFWAALAAARMAVQLRHQRCQHIHAHFAHGPADVAMYAAAMLGLPFTFTGHAQDLFKHGELLPHKAARARALLTISHFNREWLEAQGVAPDKIDVVRCTPDAGGPAVKAASPGRQGGVPGLRSRLRSGAYRIGTCGPLSERQGMDDVLRALALLIRSHCAPVKLLIAGEGPERLRLQVLADQLGIHRQVEYVGHVPTHALPQWLASLDLFVAAPKPDRQGDTDGIPVPLMEAMAAGLPCVATGLGGLPELVLDGQTGYLAEPDNPASLASQIDKAMSEPERARALGRAARAHVRWEFGREVNVRRLLRHFGDAEDTRDNADIGQAA